MASRLFLLPSVFHNCATQAALELQLGLPPSLEAHGLNPRNQVSSNQRAVRDAQTSLWRIRVPSIGFDTSAIVPTSCRNLQHSISNTLTHRTTPMHISAPPSVLCLQRSASIRIGHHTRT